MLAKRTIIGVEARVLGFVAAGSALGALTRWALTALPGFGHLPTSGTLVANLIGAFVLGTVLEGLREPLLRAWLADVRMLMGSGFCAGLTTYSSFALELIRMGATSPIEAAIYATLTILGGLTLATVGFQVGSAIRKRRWRRRRGQA
ncbi:MAG: CrcB family protein [Bowdeniella nasicola]|nr:CrcB family protein [Bowdeniella nasicola]